MDRRQFVGAVGLSVGGLAGATTRVSVGPVASWEPSPETWPLARYDAANTAAATGATPPADPTLGRLASPLEFVTSLVVGPNLAFVTRQPVTERDGRGPTVAALDRSSGEVRWTVRGPGGRLALRDGTLYVAGADSGHLRALDAATGDERWRTDGAVGNEAAAMTVADGTVYVGGWNDFAAVGADGGARRWRDGSTHLAAPAVARGALFVAGGRVRRYRPRRVSDAVTGGAPPVDWTAEPAKQGRPVVAGGRVVIGEHGDHATPGLHAFDAATGEGDWALVDALEIDGSNRVRVGSPAVAGGRCFFDVHRPPQPDGEGGEGGDGGGGRPAVELVACSLADGNVAWRRAIPGAEPVTVFAESPQPHVAVAGDSVLLRTAAAGDAAGGTVRAFSPGGDERWSVDVPAAPDALAPAGNTVYVGTDGGVYALQ